MSLEQFLAVGRSFAESPREKSPFEVRKDVRLPRFDGSPRYAPKQVLPVQTDWLAPHTAAPIASPPFATSAASSAEPTRKVRRKRRWLEVLTLGLLGKPKAGQQLVQTEMNLSNVRVMRNDLADSDLEVVVNKKKKFALRKVRNSAAANTATEPAEPARAPVKHIRDPKNAPEWSELAARLFEIGQR